ncbi:MAG: radical SAM protein [Deltaproteobacteria bacterium]|nr:radical SAM protein [Deltaproteobacteria bacterium]
MTPYLDLAALRSQARTAWLHRTLWKPSQLVRAAMLPIRERRSRDGRAPRPLILAWYVTFACGESCSFCNVTRVLAHWGSALDGPGARRVLDRLVPQIPTVAFGGGEPLAHPDILDLVARVGRLGGRVFLATSATRMVPEVARGLARAAPRIVQASLLGDETVHDSLTGVPGGWRRRVDGIANLLASRDPRRTRVVVNTVLSSENAGVLDRVVRLAQTLGVDGVHFTYLSFVTRSELAGEARNPTCLCLPDEDLRGIRPREILAALHRAQAAWPGHVTVQPRLDPSEAMSWFSVDGGVDRDCPSLWHTLFLRPDGSLVPCGHLLESPVRVHPADDLDEAWNHPSMRALRQARRAGSFSFCRRCCKV